MTPIPYHSDGPVTLYHGDALTILRDLPDGSVDCCVTSPPYFWMRDYGVDGQIGLESTPQEYLDELVAVFTEVRRVLSNDGTLWINLGDAYSQRKAVRRSSHQEGMHGARGARPSWRESRAEGRARMSAENLIDGVAVPEKSMMMLPERLAIALTSRGWLVRNRITWAKASSVPDPALDRLAVRSEPIYMLSKSSRYHFDRAALGSDDGDVWRLPVSTGSGNHTATYPVALAQRCIVAGCKPGGVVLDPFSGSGSTGAAALSVGRTYVGIDLNAEYLDLSLQSRLAR